MRQTCSCLLLAVILSGCANPSPRLDALFGDSVRQAKALQTLNPKAGAEDATLPTLDAASARNAIERQRESFKNPASAAQDSPIGAGRK